MDIWAKKQVCNRCDQYSPVDMLCKNAARWIGDMDDTDCGRWRAETSRQTTAECETGDMIDSRIELRDRLCVDDVRQVRLF